MLKYVRPSITWVILRTPFYLIISVIFWGVSAFIFINLVLQQVIDVTMTCLLVLFLLMDYHYGRTLFAPLLDYRAMIKFLKRRNIYDEAVIDFHVARSFLYDSIRLGNQCVFCRNHCTILRYTDICRIYQRVHRRDFMELKRELCAVDTSGNIWSLCSLDTHCIFTPKWNEASDKRLVEILSLMLSKNNKIVIGYW